MSDIQEVTAPTAQSIDWTIEPRRQPTILAADVRQPDARAELELIAKASVSVVEVAVWRQGVESRVVPALASFMQSNESCVEFDRLQNALRTLHCTRDELLSRLDSLQIEYVEAVANGADVVQIETEIAAKRAELDRVTPRIESLQAPLARAAEAAHQEARQFVGGALTSERAAISARQRQLLIKLASAIRPALTEFCHLAAEYEAAPSRPEYVVERIAPDLARVVGESKARDREHSQQCEADRRALAAIHPPYADLPRIVPNEPNVKRDPRMLTGWQFELAPEAAQSEE